MHKYSLAFRHEIFYSLYQNLYLHSATAGTLYLSMDTHTIYQLLEHTIYFYFSSHATNLHEIKINVYAL